MKNFQKSAGEKIISGVSGALKRFGHVSDRFSDLFPRFQTIKKFVSIYFQGQFHSADMPP